MDNTSQLQTQQFLETIKNIDSRVSNLEKTPQTQFIDWTPITPSLLSIYNASTLFTTDGYNLGLYLTPGTKLSLWFSNGGFANYYVVYNNYLPLYAGAYITVVGDGYSSYIGTTSLPVGATVVQARCSKNNVPAGFESYFIGSQGVKGFTPGGSSVTKNSSSYEHFSICEGIVFVNGLFAYTSGGTPLTSIIIERPTYVAASSNIINERPMTYFDTTTNTGNLYSYSQDITFIPNPSRTGFVASTLQSIEYNYSYPL